MDEHHATCKNCGKIFVFRPKSSGRHPHYCSLICRAAARLAYQTQYRERHPKPAREVSLFDLPRPRGNGTCRHCGNSFSFVIRTKHPAYCSESCRHQAHRLADLHRSRDRRADHE